MIPQSELEKLVPFQDQVNRTNQVRSKRKIPARKGRLTKRARQWAYWIDSMRYPTKSTPKGTKWKGQKPMSERK